MKDLKSAYEWLRASDRPVIELYDPKVFREVLYRLEYRLNGTPAAGDTMRRRRRALNAALEYAVDAGILPDNPLHRTMGKRTGSLTRLTGGFW
jgi:hypothetical protein